MWKEIMQDIAIFNPFARLNSPATDEDILQVETELKIKLPTHLRELLFECNGDNDFILSTTQIIRDNLELRGIEGYRNVIRLLLVARNSCGDFYGHPITDTEVKDEIFFWDHETDELTFMANDLKEIIKKYCSDEL